jgi:hypothetical protein
MTLIDSVRKKVDFQRHIIRVPGLKGTEVIHGRVQDKAVLRDLGGRFDIILSRAFSDLRTLLALSLPFLRQEGKVLAMKGGVDDDPLPGCIRATRRRLRTLQPDLVHGQGTERDCALSAIFSGFPNVVTIHGNMAELARTHRNVADARSSSRCATNGVCSGARAERY